MSIKKVLETIEREFLIEKGDRVLVAFSGGADSSVLLHMLKALQKDLQIELFSAHLNHQIRGAAAHEDALFAYRRSRELGIRCFVRSVDVPLLAKNEKLSMEEAARKARYEMFDDLVKKMKITKIATAHNMDDQAETIMMRIMRGTGIQGLKGIDYKRGNVIRPLLDIKRYEIEEYCHLNGIVYKTDETNLEPIYTRNKIRLELFPFIENDFACNIKEILSRMASGIREDALYLEEEARRLYAEITHGTDADNIRIEYTNLKAHYKPIIKRVIRLAYAELSGSAEGLEHIHLEDAIKLLANPKQDAMIHLPKGIIAQKKGYNLYITKSEIDEEEPAFEYEVVLNGITRIPELDLEIETKIMNKHNSKLLSSSGLVKAFDLEKLSGRIFVRNRKSGDRIKPLGLGGTKKIKDIFIDKKVPQESRGRVPIFHDQEKIIWVAGYDISEESKISESTKKVVRIIVRPMKKD